MVDTSLMERGIGIAFIGIGGGIALGAMKSFIDKSPKRKGKGSSPVIFKPPKMFEPIQMKKWK